MTIRKTQRGKRLTKTYEQKRRAYQAYSRAQVGKSTAGKREATDEKRGTFQLWQLMISAVLLVSIVTIKLCAPDTLEPLRTQLLPLMGTNTDFEEVFSSLGRAASGEEDVAQVLNDAYVAVFGTTDIMDNKASISLPEDVCMTQQVLGFAYAAPLDGEINERFGYRQHPTSGAEVFHYGIDMQADTGDVIGSFADGTVTAVGESSTLGKYVTVLHENNYTSLYAHCSRITASSGQQVRLGDPVAEVGKTGQATGPHLHFELYKDTQYLNPIYYVE